MIDLKIKNKNTKFRSELCHGLRNQALQSSLSTGQKIKEQIKTALNSKVQFLLLDEWDANLDEKNRSEILEVLREFCQSGCVINISHRNA